MNLVEQKYIDGQIWTMRTPRDSCVVPETPLLIDETEERDLNELALGVWNAFDCLVDLANTTKSPMLQTIRNQAAAFPEGLTMPPAIRVDVVRTADGPKIVEADPITAISLGETVFLDDVWSSEGYYVLGGLARTIADEISTRAEALAIRVPSAKSAYTGDISYLARSLAANSVRVKVDQPASSGTVALSAFMEDPATRKAVNRCPARIGDRNPLWGSLVGLSTKRNLDMLQAVDKIRLPKFLPRQFNRDELEALPDETPLVCKPVEGTGSTQVRLVTADVARNVGSNYVIQEVLEPIQEDYGKCKAPDKEMVTGPWVSRLSIYAGRYGLVGAQVTARQADGIFTNVHGQPDAVQTALAVWKNNG